MCLDQPFMTRSRPLGGTRIFPPRLHVVLGVEYQPNKLVVVEALFDSEH